MSGITRWKDLQNITTTEDEINLLAGLTALAEDINRIVGFIGSGTDLNTAVASASTLVTHMNKTLTQAHPILPGTLDGGALANSTVPLSKLSFVPMTSTDNIRISNDLATLTYNLNQASSQIQNLYSIVLPNQANNIADSINQLIQHIEKLADAHDATAISFGNQYSTLEDTLSGSSQSRVDLTYIKYFKVNDEVKLQSSSSAPEIKIVNEVNYDTGHISFATPVSQDFKVSESYIIFNLSQDNVQEGIDRSLRNTTDEFSGRLKITQNTSNNALEIYKTGAGYTAKFNDFSAQSGANYGIELGANDGSTNWSLKNSDQRTAASITDDGHASFNTVSLEDRGTSHLGKVTKQTLTQDQEWKLPDRSGYVGIGDLSFTELLKVKIVPGTKVIEITKGYTYDYEGQLVSAWLTMEEPSRYDGGFINLQNQMSNDGQLLSIGSNWQVVTVFIDDSDNVKLFYGPQEATEQEALDEYENFIPSAYMKLALILIQGDGFGGISQPSIKIIEDQRPFLSMGLSAAYYDESIIMNSGLSAGSVVALPPNSRGGGAQITYRPGKSQVEVYLDGTYQRAGVDFEEFQGEPVAQIRMLKDIPTHSELRFRITFKAAAVAGGIQVDTLQTVYQNGASIALSSLYGPILMSSYDMETLLDITGNIIVNGLVRAVDALEFDPQSIIPGISNVDKLLVNTNHDLIFHQFKAGQAKDWNILEEIKNAQSAVLITVFNATGSAIAKGRALALHPSLTNHVVLCDTSNSLNTSRVEGISFETIPSGGSGVMIVSGIFENSGLALPHATVLVVDPRNPGMLVNRTSVNFLPDDQYMEVGKMNGSTIIVNIDRNKKGETVWKKGIAGEAFSLDVTKIVRYAVDGETRGSFYKADKNNANIDQKFWAIAAIRPSSNISAGGSISLYKEIELGLSETPFSDSDIGKPIYLGSDGDFKPWSQIKNTYQAGDAIVKIGMIEDRRKFVIDSIQQMGTANGPMV